MKLYFRILPASIDFKITDMVTPIRFLYKNEVICDKALYNDTLNHFIERFKRKYQHETITEVHIPVILDRES